MEMAPKEPCTECEGGGIRGVLVPIHTITYGDWTESTTVPHEGGDFRVLWLTDGTGARFEHLCDRTSTDRGFIVCAPVMMFVDGQDGQAHHTLVSRDPVTISPSILCSDCQTHGFITDGQWVQA